MESASGLTCESRVVAVEVFARGALVTRAVTVPEGEGIAGAVTVVLRGVTLLAEPGSFRAALEGGARAVRSVRVAREVPSKGAMTGAAVSAMEALERKAHRIQSELDEVYGLRARLSTLELQPRMRASAPLEGPGSLVQRTAEAIATDGMIGDLSAELDARKIALQTEKEALQKEIAAARLVLAQARSAVLQGEGHPSYTVRVELTGEGAIEGLTVTYAVMAARWWPRYTLRLDDHGKRGRWRVEALVAQQGGEDWRGVKLSLSTADLLFDARLPTLPSLRLGKVQPPKRAFRAAPVGLDAMFGSYDKAFGQMPLSGPPVTGSPRPLGGPPPLGQALAKAADEPSPEKGDRLMATHAGGYQGYVEIEAEEDLDDGRAEMVKKRQEPTRSRAAPLARAAMPANVPMPQAMPARKSGGAMDAVFSAALAPVGLVADALAGVAGGGGPGAPGGVSYDEGGAAAAVPVEPSDAWMAFDSLVLGGPAGGAKRGRLTREADATAHQRQVVVQSVEAVEVPLGLEDPRRSRGMFDHRFAVEGLAEVPADGQLHRVSLGGGESTPVLRWRAVPRENAEVFREAELRNPLDAPLLSGPVEVFLDGSLLTVAHLERVDRGGTMNVGMGTESRIRIARNVRTTEETAGLLGGDTIVTHHVSIELSSALGTSVLVEVVDRIPVSDEKGVEVVALSAKPEGEAYNQSDRGAPVRGGRRWQVIVPAGGKATIEHGYRVTFASKLELVGGNRRD